MAAPILRHYRFSNTAVTTWEAAHANVPASRALVVSKLIVVNSGSAAFTFHASAGSGFGGVDTIIGNTILGPGEVYTEAGLVLLAGERIGLHTTSAAGATHIKIFGQEVDN